MGHWSTWCVCVCAWVCVGVWQGEGARAGAITRGVVENTRAAKYNNHGSPGITGSPVSHASPCQTTPWVIIGTSCPVTATLIHTTNTDNDAPRPHPLQNSLFCSPSTRGGSRRSRFSDAAAPSTRHLWSSYHRTPVEIKAHYNTFLFLRAKFNVFWVLDKMCLNQ